MKRLSAALLAAAAIPASAACDDKRLRDVSSAWIVMPGIPAASPVTIHKGELIARSRLLPIGYATLDADAVDADGDRPIIPAGTPMMQLSAKSGTVECVIGEPPKSGLGNFWAGFKGGDTRICLRDADRDGRFEEFVRYKGLVQGLPSVNGRLPKALHPLKVPVGYSAQDPRAMATQYFLAIKYEGHALLGGNPVFIDAFGQDGDYGTLNRTWPRGPDGKGKVQHTGRVLLDGAVINVTADDGETLSAVVEQPVPGGIFGVSQVGGNIFY